LISPLDGRWLDTGLPEGSTPLAFAPDDRAPWVRDDTGLLLELSLPAVLPDDDEESPLLEE
jgi:hypothetical protein